MLKHPSPTAALQAIHPIIPILGGNSFVVAPKKNLIWNKWTKYA